MLDRATGFAYSEFEHICGHGVVATCDLPKVETVGSNPIARSNSPWRTGSQIALCKRTQAMGQQAVGRFLQHALLTRGRAQAFRLGYPARA